MENEEDGIWGMSMRQRNRGNIGFHIFMTVAIIVVTGWFLSLFGPVCAMPGCNEECTNGSRYCFLHDMSYRTYGNPDFHSIYQKNHSGSSYSRKSSSSNNSVKSQTESKTTGSNTHSNSKTYSGTKKSYDAYDVEEYDNPDDFAEEWAEEFGDGDYESGYEDAYDYWGDERE